MNTICGYSQRGSRRHLVVGFIPIDYYSSAVCRVAAYSPHTYILHASRRSESPARLSRVPRCVVTRVGSRQS